MHKPSQAWWSVSSKARPGQKRNYTVVKGAQIKLYKAEYASSTGHIALHTMDLLHLDCVIKNGVYQAWGKVQTMQQRRIHKPSPAKMIVQKAWGISQCTRGMHQIMRQLRTSNVDVQTTIVQMRSVLEACSKGQTMQQWTTAQNKLRNPHLLHTSDNTTSLQPQKPSTADDTSDGKSVSANSDETHTGEELAVKVLEDYLTVVWETNRYLISLAHKVVGALGDSTHATLN